jgi:hypothetical protein
LIIRLMAAAAGGVVPLYPYFYDEPHTSPGAQGSHEAAFLPQTSKVDHDVYNGGNGCKREKS